RLPPSRSTICAKAGWWCATLPRSRSTRCSAPTTGLRAGACSSRLNRRSSWSMPRCRNMRTKPRSDFLSPERAGTPSHSTLRDATNELASDEHPMRNGNADDIAKLIEPGRVHRDVYTDPDIFELEMERIFGRAWLFVGHASQVPQAGDFVTTELGRQP